jgi:predicted GIY-YIG superfamily endonuclease
MSRYHYVYVLQSEKDGNFYVGYTRDDKKAKFNGILIELVCEVILS